MLTSGCVVDFLKENLGLFGFDIVEFVGSIRYFVLLNKVKMGKKQVFCKILWMILTRLDFEVKGFSLICHTFMPFVDSFSFRVSGCCFNLGMI